MPKIKYSENKQKQNKDDKWERSWTWNGSIILKQKKSYWGNEWVSETHRIAKNQTM